MATLAEAFLADLEDLSDGEPEQGEGDVQEELNDDVEDVEDLEMLNYDDLSLVAKLNKEPRYADILQRVRQAMNDPPPEERQAGHLEDDPTYKLLVECNKLAVDIDNEIAVVHNYIRDKYRLKFPELESLVHHPIDYARVVQRIGNEMDVTLVDLDDILPAATVMVVTVTATTTTGRPLTEDNFKKTGEGCEMAFALDEDKRDILQFVESRMHQIAPNLSVAVGTEVAAKLMGVAGGLLSLSRMPACNVQVLGAKRKTLVGFSTTTAQPHQGFIFSSHIIQQTPPSLRVKAARLVANRCTLLARIDANSQDPGGSIGEKFKAEMLAKIEKWQEPPPAKQAKPLAVPDAEPKKRRGGRRYRKLKERYGMTEVRKAVNRVSFNQPEEEYIDGDDVIGLGMLGKEGSGRLRIVAAQQKLKLTAKTQKKYNKQQQRFGGTTSGLATSGLTTSLAFTPVQGFELSNPSGQNLFQPDQKDGTQSYFSDLSGFRSIKRLG